MDVPRVDSAQLRLAAAQMQADTTLDLVRGDRFTATVVTIHEAGEIVLATPRGSFVSHTDVRLAPGQALQLEVVKGGAAPLLRIIDGAFHFDEQAFAEAVLEAVRRHVVAERQAGRQGRQPDARQLASALRAHLAASATGPLTADQRVTVARLLAPLDPRGTSNEIAEHLRRLIEHGGTLLEPRLRVALGAADGGPALPDEVSDDLRVLLAALLKPGTDDAARASVRQRLSAQLASDVLERQIEQALQWVKHGTLVAELPVAGDRDERVRMEYEREAGGTAADDEARGQSLRLGFDVETLGRIDVLVTWTRGTASLRVRTDDAVTREHLAAGLGELRAALQARGVALSHADVVVDAADVAPPELPTEPPPSGSILRLVG